jgi:hypothetical protein
VVGKSGSTDKKSARMWLFLKGNIILAKDAHPKTKITCLGASCALKLGHGHQCKYHDLLDFVLPCLLNNDLTKCGLAKQNNEG